MVPSAELAVIWLSVKAGSWPQDETAPFKEISAAPKRRRKLAHSEYIKPHLNGKAENAASPNLRFIGVLRGWVYRKYNYREKPL
jgi:hypothetical protein